MNHGALKTVVGALLPCYGWNKTDAEYIELVARQLEAKPVLRVVAPVTGGILLAFAMLVATAVLETFSVIDDMLSLFGLVAAAVIFSPALSLAFTVPTRAESLLYARFGNPRDLTYESLPGAPAYAEFEELKKVLLKFDKRYALFSFAHMVFTAIILCGLLIVIYPILGPLLDSVDYWMAFLSFVLGLAGGLFLALLTAQGILLMLYSLNLKPYELLIRYCGNSEDATDDLQRLVQYAHESDHFED